MRYNQTADIDIEEIIHETEKAILVKLNSKYQTWIPKAMLIEEPNEDYVTVYGNFNLKEIPIPVEEDITDMFSDISEKEDPRYEVPSSEEIDDIVKASQEKFPTPFD